MSHKLLAEAMKCIFMLLFLNVIMIALMLNVRAKLEALESPGKCDKKSFLSVQTSRIISVLQLSHASCGVCVCTHNTLFTIHNL